MIVYEMVYLMPGLSVRTEQLYVPEDYDEEDAKRTARKFRDSLPEGQFLGLRKVTEVQL